GYINVEPRVVPHTGGRVAKFRFHKSNTFIIERLMNKLMNCGHKAKKHFITSGHMTGKAQTSFRIMEDVLKTIESRTKQNPIAVVVKAIENAAPREEIVTIEYGGARYPKAVEVAPQRRVDQALKMIVQTAYQKAFNSKKSIVAALTDELLAAFNCTQQSGAVSKKLELERQADSSR
ncbi:TPA: 30S ribosomal protein S7, partial [Candidatus Woesearchaeota archaeon]|nr:30S ribosomal protein S7 [Candidatus Woesearchaeota archaeon]